MSNEAPDDTLEVLQAWLRNHINAKQLSDRAKTVIDETKKGLLEYASTLVPDDRGHVSLTVFPEGTPGPTEGKVVTGFTRQRRAKSRLDADKVRALLADRGVPETEVFKEEIITNIVLDEPALQALAFQGVLSTKDLDSCYTMSESFAFILD